MLLGFGGSATKLVCDVVVWRMIAFAATPTSSSTFRMMAEERGDLMHLSQQNLRCLCLHTVGKSSFCFVVTIKHHERFLVGYLEAYSCFSDSRQRLVSRIAQADNAKKALLPLFAFHRSKTLTSHAKARPRTTKMSLGKHADQGN